MKIIDSGNYKGDYYDFLSYQYKDESDYEDPTYYRISDFGIPRRSLVTLEKNKNFVYILYSERPNFAVEFSELGDITYLDVIKRSKFGKYYLDFFIIEAGYTQYLFMEPLNLDTLRSEEVIFIKRYSQGARLSYDGSKCYRPLHYIPCCGLRGNKKKKFIDSHIEYPEEILNFNFPDNIIELNHYIRRDRGYREIIDPNFGKGEIQLTGLIKPEDIYFSIDQYLREEYRKDEDFEDNGYENCTSLEKNNLKIINNGFDPKHSFRKRH